MSILFYHISRFLLIPNLVPLVRIPDKAYNNERILRTSAEISCYALLLKKIKGQKYTINLDFLLENILFCLTKMSTQFRVLFSPEILPDTTSKNPQKSSLQLLVTPFCRLDCRTSTSFPPSLLFVAGLLFFL